MVCKMETLQVLQEIQFSAVLLTRYIPLPLRPPSFSIAIALLSEQKNANFLMVLRRIGPENQHMRSANRGVR